MKIEEKINEIQMQYEMLKERILKEEAIIENAKMNIVSATREIYIAQGKYQALEELMQEKFGEEDTQAP